MKLNSFKLNTNSAASGVGLILALLLVGLCASRASNNETAMRRAHTTLEACT